MAKLRNKHLNALNLKENSSPSPDKIWKAYSSLYMEYKLDKKTNKETLEKKLKEIAAAKDFLDKPQDEQDRLENEDEVENGFNGGFEPAGKRDNSADRFFNNVFKIREELQNDLSEAESAYFESLKRRHEQSPKDKYQFITQQGPNDCRKSLFEAFNDLAGLKKLITESAKKMDTYAKTNLLVDHLAYQISELPENLVKEYDTNHSEALVQALLKHNQLIEVQAPQWMFSDAQRALLNEHMKHAKAERDAIKEKAKNFYKDNMRRTVWGIILTLALTFLLTVGFVIGSASGPLTVALGLKALLYAIPTVLFCFLLSCGIGIAKQAYNRYAEVTYHAQKLDNIHDPVEIEALQLGVKATKGWKEYAQTYRRLPAYSRYKAFIAGYNHAMQNHEEIVRKITALKAH